ncbi:MAG: hypothetical protein J6X27_03780 [Bacteroidaceae bacterium]|nr:hypothetical protein [Bacteroidaceae bacterium]
MPASGQEVKEVKDNTQASIKTFDYRLARQRDNFEEPKAPITSSGEAAITSERSDNF